MNFCGSPDNCQGYHKDSVPLPSSHDSAQCLLVETPHTREAMPLAACPLLVDRTTSRRETRRLLGTSLLPALGGPRCRVIAGLVVVGLCTAATATAAATTTSLATSSFCRLILGILRVVERDIAAGRRAEV